MLQLLRVYVCLFVVVLFFLCCFLSFGRSDNNQADLLIIDNPCVEQMVRQDISHTTSVKHSFL